MVALARLCAVAAAAGLLPAAIPSARSVSPAPTDPRFAVLANGVRMPRVLLGMGEGLTLPALHHVTARWAPVHERARFVTVSVSGQYLGTSLTLLCAPMVSVWWPGIFYLFVRVHLTAPCAIS